MPISLSDLDLLANGNVTAINPTFSQTVQRSKIINAETITTVMEPTERSWSIVGFFRDSIEGNADYDTLNELLTRGDVYPFANSRNDYDAPRFAFVKLAGAGYGFPSGHLLNYSLQCFEVPAWGRTSCDTDNVSLLDKIYRKAYRELLSPLWHKCDWAMDPYTRYFQYDFYVRNDGDADLDPVFEIQVPDSLTSAQLLYYKDDTDKWQEIGYWGDTDSWGDTEEFTDAGPVTHEVTLNATIRDGAVTGVGTASLRFGCEARLMFNITNLKLDDTGGVDAKTKYDSDQLLLRLKIVYESDVTTWIDSLV